MPDPCFPEPTGPAAGGRWTRDIRASLLGSTTLRAQVARAFLNRQLEALPPDIAAALCHRIRVDPFDQAYFELVVGRFLQLLGATLDYEPVGANGRKVDFRATFPDGSVYVEATSPEYNRESARDVRHQGPLLDIIEDEAPDGWSVAVWELPNLGPNDRRAAFRTAVRAMFADLPTPVPDVWVPRSGRVVQGAISVDLLPVRYSDGAIVVSPGGGYVDNTRLRVAGAVRDDRKIKQGRAFPGQVILAIGPGPFATHRDDLDVALLGTSVMVLGRDRQVQAYRFDANGALATQQVPEFPAVLAFPRLGIAGGDDPILYVHPKFQGTLPDALLVLEQRRLGADGILGTSATQTGIIDALGFPTTDD